MVKRRPSFVAIVYTNETDAVRLHSVWRSRGCLGPSVVPFGLALCNVLVRGLKLPSQRRTLCASAYSTHRDRSFRLINRLIQGIVTA